jgi:dTDP-4-amino-4,6-dideoxygalactose transaminase
MNKYKIPYRDLSVYDQDHKKRLLRAVDKVLSHGRILLGPESSEFEKRAAKVCGKKYGVGVGSGSDALYLALRALDIKEGDEVLTTPLSWIATYNAIALTGATPVSVDVKEDMNINPEEIEKNITNKTKAIVVVHFTGKMCDMQKIMEIANKYNLEVIEDAAQVFGAHDIYGKAAGSYGRLSSYSINPMKPFCSYGEAGLVITDEVELKERLERLRYNGMLNKEFCNEPSINGRIDTIQAAMLLVNFDYYQDWIKTRNEYHKIYEKEISHLVKTPKVQKEEKHCFHAYNILVDEKDRDPLIEFLENKGIETKISHPILMPDQEAYKKLKQKEIPIARNIVKRIITLPNHEKLNKEDIFYICDCIKEFYGEKN